MKKGDVDPRRRNAQNVARRMLSDAKALAAALVQIEMQKVRIEALEHELGLTRETLVQSLRNFYRPKFDGAEMPGDLTVMDTADLELDIGVRARPHFSSDGGLQVGIEEAK